MKNENIFKIVKKSVKLLMNILLFGVLGFSVFMLAICFKTEWTSSGYIYSDSASCVLEVFSILEIVVSMILLMINRHRITIAILITTNIFAIYKLLDYHFLF